MSDFNISEKAKQSNALTPIFGNHLDQTARNNSIASLLEKVCQVLSPTEAQRKLAEERYNAAGSWVARATDKILHGGNIFAQGSFAIGTVVRPINAATIDVDLIYLVPNPAIDMQPSSFKKALGDRLREHGTYRDMLSPKSGMLILIEPRGSTRGTAGSRQTSID